MPLEDFLQQGTLCFCNDAFKRAPRFHKGGFLSRCGEADVHLAITRDAAMKVVDRNE